MRKRDNENFLPITCGVCLLLTVGAYFGLKQKGNLAHHSYDIPLQETPITQEVQEESFLKNESTAEESLIDFKNDILYNKNMKDITRLFSNKDNTSIRLMYKDSFFRRSSYELYNHAQEKLVALTPLLKKHGNVMIKIHAHTDKTPVLKRKYRDWNTQAQLASLRGNSIRNYLIGLGVNPYQISIVEGHSKQMNSKNNRAITFTFVPVPTSSTLAGVVD